MTREEKILSIYGQNGIHADVNGWMKYGMFKPSCFGFDNNEVERYGDMQLWRPKSLLGIEDNNGWIKIESDTMVPDGDYWMVENEENEIIAVFDIDKDSCQKSIRKYYTHYQPITKPQPPLY